MPYPSTPTRSSTWCRARRPRDDRGVMEDLGGTVRGELDKLGPGGAIVDVVRVWPSAVGEQIARNAWPARVARDGTLHVATSSSAWAFELGHLEADVRARLGELAPA